jgi:hypothetical protein
MKTQRLIMILFALTFAFAPQSFRTASAERGRFHYSAELISPRAGEVLVPGQVVRVEWTSVLPNIDLNWCETEIRLSLDGGTTFTWITGERDPRVTHFDWTVPNTPTNTAVLDIHFGCLGYFPETASIQVQSAFVISALKD